jgi:hypothetical protein
MGDLPPVGSRQRRRPLEPSPTAFGPASCARAPGFSREHDLDIVGAGLRAAVHLCWPSSAGLEAGAEGEAGAALEPAAPPMLVRESVEGSDATRSVGVDYERLVGLAPERDP